MKKIFVVFILISLFVASWEVQAAANPTQLTPGLQLSAPPVIGVGRVTWLKILTVQYDGGKMMLSSAADGTGSMQVGDTIQLFINPAGEVASYTFTYNSYSSDCRIHTPLPATDLTQYFHHTGTYNITARILDWCGQTQTISPLYLVNTGLPDPILSPTPIPSPTPTTGPKPFLDLPWDYSQKGLDFTDAALSMTSFFDHEYPLLSSGLPEPSQAKDTVITFDQAHRVDQPYSSHDGYDYARQAKALLGDPVLAAAAGWATYVNTCTACGNMIVIDHGNGYQTRYFHLQKEGLLTDVQGQKIYVTSRQMIGKIGASGHVIPGGNAGAHIHFMVVEDKNHDGNFDDNIPDGVTDPFGWQVIQPDPWGEYSFIFNGANHTGNKSYYLWTKNLDGTKGTITPNNTFFVANHYGFSFPSTLANQNYLIQLTSSPMVKLSNSISSIGPSIRATLTDYLNNSVTQLPDFFNISVDFSNFDLRGFKPESLAIYSSPDGVNWSKENTIVDLSAKNATAQVNHFTYYALMGEHIDANSPSTNAELAGIRGQDTWFRSDVDLKLSADDNQGIGVDYTLYRVDGGDWETYLSPIHFSQEGHYKVDYYSVDQADNVEDMKTIEFDIDKTAPEVQAWFDTKSLDIVFKGLDDKGSSVVTQNPLPKKGNELYITDEAGNQLKVIIKEKTKGRDARLVIESLRYNQDQVFNIPDNILTMQYGLDEKIPDLKMLEQTFKIIEGEKLKLVYKQSTDQTKIINIQKDYEMQSDIVNGLKLLQINTQKGTLRYGY